MGRAPVTRIAHPPLPATSGLTLTVLDDDGAQLPDPPFVGLAWPVQELPVAGVNAERLAVTDVTGDVVSFLRALVPVAIQEGWQFAALSTIPTYERGDTVLVRHGFAGSAPCTATLRDPQGSLSHPDATCSSLGLASLSFAADRGGIWRWRIDSELPAHVEGAVFVDFSETLD